MEVTKLSRIGCASVFSPRADVDYPRNHQGGGIFRERLGLNEEGQTGFEKSDWKEKVENT
jgi:hypothetical protein